MAGNQEFVQECADWIFNTLPKSSTALYVGTTDNNWVDLLNNHILMDGIQVFTPNKISFGMKHKFKNFFDNDARGFLFGNYDLIILDNILEFMTVDEAQQMIAYMRPRCKEMIIAVEWCSDQTFTTNMNPSLISKFQNDLTIEKFNERLPGFTPLIDNGKIAFFKKDKPEFTIIVPAHNESERIDTALRSIKEQSLKDYEVLVVCDNCTDDTEEKAKSYGFTTISGVFGSAGAARNAGLDRASGEYVLFLDADDRYLHTEALALLHGVSTQTKQADVIAFAFIFGWLGLSPVNGNKGGMFPNVWSKLWKRSAIGETRFEKLNFAEDQYFCNAVFSKGAIVARWDFPLVYYTYPRPGSLTDQHMREAH